MKNRTASHQPAAPATLHLLLGPVGAGKSTYARHRASQAPAVFLNLDAWMVRLFGADTRPEEGVMAWYLERRDRCRGLLWDTALEVLAAGTDVFYESGLLTRAERQAFYEAARANDIELRVYVLDAPRAVRRERVAQRNLAATADTQIVPVAFFERASDAWQPPDEEERATWGIIDV